MIGTAALAASLALLRVYNEAVPVGADSYEYFYRSSPGPTFASRDGRRSIRAVYGPVDDHGDYRTWLIADDWLGVKRLVAEGYSLPTVRHAEAKFPMRWLDDRTMEVQFVSRRQGGRLMRRVIRLR
jgi:hypothetical protein